MLKYLGAMILNRYYKIVTGNLGAKGVVSLFQG